MFNLANHLRKHASTILSVAAFALVAFLLPSANAATASWSRATATWYGPGFYGHGFACPHTGNYNEARSRGIATNTRFARCGSWYTLRYRHHTIHVRVIDRCPGCNTTTHPFDLTARSDRDLLGCRNCRPYTLHGVRYHHG